MRRRIYVDHAATTPLDARVRAAMLPWLGERFGVPSAPHSRGAEARAAVEAAREAVGALLGAPPEGILFTGSATEANNLAVKGLAFAAPEGAGRLVAAATEHISVLHPLRSLERRGFDLTLLPVDLHGLVDPEAFAAALAPGVRLASVAHASAEIGSLQPIAALARAARARGVPLHVDATVTAGICPLPDGEDGPDLVTLTPHLFYGPPGVGALYARPGIRLAPLIEGGTQEGGRRAGSEAVAAIVGFGEAAMLARAERDARRARAAAAAARLRGLLSHDLPGLVPTGHPERRVPGHVSLCVPGIDAEAALSALDAAGIEAASGSPCTTEVRRPSHVLEAMGIDPVAARGALTFTFGEANGPGDADAVAAALSGIVARLRGLSPLGS